LDIINNLLIKLLAALITGFISSFYKFPVFVWGAAVAAELNDIPTVTNVNTNTNM